MKFDKAIQLIFEMDVTAQQFTDALGDKEDAERVKAETIKKRIMDAWNEYVNEAEHQDGYGFWVNNFQGPHGLEELLDDFKNYTISKNNNL